MNVCKILAVLFTLLLSNLVWSQAGGSSSVCNSIFKSSNYGCDDLAAANSAGGALPLLYDALNVNPSSLPTQLTPYGVELYKGEDDMNAALIKGLKRIGTGFSSKSTDTTFASPSENYKVALAKAIDYQDSDVGNYYNIGMALSLLDIPNWVELPLGLSAKYNADEKKWSLVWGTSIKTKYLTLAGSYNREKIGPYSTSYSTKTEVNTLYNLSATLKIGSLLADYILFYKTYESETKYSNSTYRDDYQVLTSVFTATYKIWDFVLTYGYRKQQDSRVNASTRALLNTYDVKYEDSHTMMGISYKQPKFSISVYNNYVIEEDISFVGQIFF